MAILQTIESKFNFKYPEIFHQLFQDKMLDYGKAGPTWFSCIFPTLKANPPLLLFAKEYEFFEEENFIAEIKALNNPNSNIHPTIQLVPFAHNGSGDRYCFCLNEKNGNDIPVVFVWHDRNRADIKAKNMEDFIFRTMLELVCEVDEDDLVMDGDFKNNIWNMLKTHKKYLPEKQVQILTQIFNRNFDEDGLLNRDELSWILLDTINFDRLNKEFKCYHEN